MLDRESLTRRQFLLEAASSAALARTVRAAPMLFGATSGGPRQGKPALTRRSINEYIAAARREDESTQLLLAAEAKRNLLAFLDQRFELSDAQRHVFQTLTQEDHRRINAAIETALHRDCRLVFRSTSGPGGDGGADSASAKATVTVAYDATVCRASVPNGEVVVSWPCPGDRGRASGS